MDGDLELVKRILDGEVRAWQEFVETHTPLMRSVISGFSVDGEVAADLYISLLEKLKAGKLSGYSGKSTLRTWLFVVAGNHCRDHFRSESGIRHVRKAVEGLSRFDRRFFQLYYVDALPIRETIESLRLEIGREISFLDIIEADRRIVKEMARRKLGRLLDKLIASGRGEGRFPALRGGAFHDPDLLESSSPSPDALQGSRDLQKVMELLEEAVALLSKNDRMLLRMRFQHGESARRIGELLGFHGAKEVYRKLDSVYAELASRIEEKGIPAETCRYVARDMDLLFPMEDLSRDGGTPN